MQTLRFHAVGVPKADHEFQDPDKESSKNAPARILETTENRCGKSHQGNGRADEHRSGSDRGDQHAGDCRQCGTDYETEIAMALALIPIRQAAFLLNATAMTALPMRVL